MLVRFNTVISSKCFIQLVYNENKLVLLKQRFNKGENMHESEVQQVISKSLKRKKKKQLALVDKIWALII